MTSFGRAPAQALHHRRMSNVDRPSRFATFGIPTAPGARSCHSRRAWFESLGAGQAGRWAQVPVCWMDSFRQTGLEDGRPGGILFSHWQPLLL